MGFIRGKLSHTGCVYFLEARGKNHVIACQYKNILKLRANKEEEMQRRHTRHLYWSKRCLIVYCLFCSLFLLIMTALQFVVACAIHFFTVDTRKLLPVVFLPKSQKVSPKKRISCFPPKITEGVPKETLSEPVIWQGEKKRRITQSKQ